jgi:hypothetical protein
VYLDGKIDPCVKLTAVKIKPNMITNIATAIGNGVLDMVKLYAPLISVGYGTRHLNIVKITAKIAQVF